MKAERHKEKPLLCSPLEVLPGGPPAEALTVEVGVGVLLHVLLRSAVVPFAVLR